MKWQRKKFERERELCALVKAWGTENDASEALRQEAIWDELTDFDDDFKLDGDENGK